MHVRNMLASLTMRIFLSLSVSLVHDVIVLHSTHHVF